jgi:hypothetical protein
VNSGAPQAPLRIASGGERAACEILDDARHQRGADTANASSRANVALLTSAVLTAANTMPAAATNATNTRIPAHASRSARALRDDQHTRPVAPGAFLDSASANVRSSSSVR